MYNFQLNDIDNMYKGSGNESEILMLLLDKSTYLARVMRK